MIDRDENGAMVPETLVLFDFDNAGWGHRIWINNFFVFEIVKYHNRKLNIR